MDIEHAHKKNNFYEKSGALMLDRTHDLLIEMFLTPGLLIDHRRGQRKKNLIVNFEKCATKSGTCSMSLQDAERVRNLLNEFARCSMSSEVGL